MVLAFAAKLSAPVGSQAAPSSQAAVNHQIATGGGSDLVRDRIVRDDGRAKAAHLLGVRAGTRKMLDKTGANKPAGAKRA